MLILASQSPRRREILERAGIRFEVRVAGVPEERLPGESAREYVRRLARAKAEAVARAATGGEAVLGADTVVAVEGHVLEKPADDADARRMLGLLSGREHTVVTGICLHSGAVVASEEIETAVHFIELSAAEIDGYVATGEPHDKAGAYAIQGRASKFIHRIDGCYFNVVGLPVAAVYRLLKARGIPI